jgi:hypothetical protein
MGVNNTHLRVLLKKNFLVLARNRCQMIFFLILPLMTMGIFVAIFHFAVGTDGNIGEANNLQRNFLFLMAQVSSSRRTQRTCKKELTTGSLIATLP